MNHQACLHISIEYARTHTHTHTNILVSPPQVHRSLALPRIGYNIPVTSSILRASFPGDPRSGRVRKLTSSLLSLLPVSIPVYTRLTLCYSSIFIFLQRDLSYNINSRGTSKRQRIYSEMFFVSICETFALSPLCRQASRGCSKITQTDFFPLSRRRFPPGSPLSRKTRLNSLPSHLAREPPYHRV